eukprot:2033733-Rhodomonas_salina.3
MRTSVGLKGCATRRLALCWHAVQTSALRVLYSSELAYAIGPCYAVCGTELTYGGRFVAVARATEKVLQQDLHVRCPLPTRTLCRVRYCASAWLYCLRARYVKSGTELAKSGTAHAHCMRCAVLSQRMGVPGRAGAQHAPSAAGVCLSQYLYPRLCLRISVSLSLRQQRLVLCNRRPVCAKLPTTDRGIC